MVKPCPSCGGENTGAGSYCKPCMAARSRAWRAAHPDKARAVKRSWEARNPDKHRQHKARSKKKARALGMAWAFESREVVQARSSEWQRRNAVHRSAYMKAWRASNPGYDNHRRRDKDTLTWSAALRLDPCTYCGGTMTDLDHIVPRALGGDSDWSNLTASCRSCNASKGDRPLLAFLATR